MNSYLAKLILLLMLASMLGCGPTVFKSDTLEKISLRTIAVFPIRIEGEVTREHRELLQNAFSRRLAAQGYQVVDSKHVGKFCAKTSCDGELPPVGVTKALGADGIVTISLDSSFTSNFLLLRLSALSGKATLYDANNNILASVSHTERERGGLLLSTGQVIDGVSSAVDSFGSMPQARLNEKFVTVLAQKLPAPQGTSSTASLAISSSDVKSLGSSRYQVCVFGTPGASAAARIDNRTIQLREASPGRYCSIVLLSPGLRKAVAMLTLPSGSGVSSPIAIPTGEVCEADDVVSASSVQKTKAGGGCKGAKLFVYEAKQKEGPFRFLRSLMAGSSKPSSNQSSVLAVVSFSPEHGASLPTLVTPKDSGVK